MSEPEKCPKCGAGLVLGMRHSFVCGTRIQARGLSKQPDDCGRRQRITELTAEVAKLKAAVLSAVQQIEAMKLEEGFSGHYHNGYGMAKTEALVIVRGLLTKSEE